MNTGEEGREVVVLGSLRVDPAARLVSIDGAEIELTAREFDLVHYLVSRAGTVCRREQILEDVWDTHWYGPTKTLDVHIAGVRRKLGSAIEIVTVRGVGFRVEREDEGAAE